MAHILPDKRLSTRCGLCIIVIAVMITTTAVSAQSKCNESISMLFLAVLSFTRIMQERLLPPLSGKDSTQHRLKIGMVNSIPKI